MKRAQKKTTKKTPQNILKNQSGQGMLEYILILVVVIAIAGLFKGKIVAAITSLTDSTSTSIQGFGNQ